MKFRKILTDIVVEQRWGQQGGDATQIFTKGFIPDVKPQTDKISKSSTPTSSGNSKKVIDYFVSKGLKPYQAAGIAANFEAESNFNPSAIGDNGKSHGLAQWRDSRWNNLQKFAKDKGEKWNDFDLQLDFTWDEMVNSYPEMLSDLRSSEDFNEATKVVMLQYEIPSDQSTSAINRRQKIAQKYFKTSGTPSTSNEELRSYFSDPLDTMTKPSGVGVWKAPRTHGKHDGIDIGAPTGSPIYSIMSGNITSVHNSGRCGNGLTITNGDWAYTFCHASKVLKKSGSVSKGEKVAEVGETGSATGPHLHFKITYKGKAIDPTPYFF